MYMKKLSLLILGISLLSACASGNPNLTPEQESAHKESLELAQSILKNTEIEGSERKEAFLAAAIAYENLGNTKKAISNYQKALEIQVDNYVALNNLANIFEEDGDIEQARYYVSYLHKYHKDKLEVIKDTIRILSKNGEFEDAILVLQEYAQLKQGDPEYASIISDQYAYIQRMSTAAEAKQAE